MMLDVKKKFQPSLDPVTEIFQLQQLAILKPIIRDGIIRREGGFSSWKDRIFAFQFRPHQSLTCTVFNNNSDKPEEVIDIAGAKLSTKCILVEEHLCFGVVTTKRMKYLISLNNGRECLKIFHELLSAKSLLKNDADWHGTGRENIHRSEEKLPSNFSRTSNEFGLVAKKMRRGSNAEEVFGLAEVERKIQRPSSIQKFPPKFQIITETDKIVEIDTAETIDDKAEHKLEHKDTKETSETLEPMSASRILQQQHPDADPRDMEEYGKLQFLGGFQVVQRFRKGKVYRNSRNAHKIVQTVTFPQSSRNIIEMFMHFQNWNNRIKDMKVISTLEKGVYKLGISFFKTGCFSSEGYCEAVASLYQVPDGYFVTMKTTKIPTNVKRSRWIDFKLSLRVRGNLENFSQKSMIASFESPESQRIIQEFVKEIKNFGEYLKTKTKLPEKKLEVKAIIYK